MHALIHKALTFRASSIGDCLMGKYLLENVHVQFPSARLGIVVAGRAGMIRDLFAAYPWLEVIEANRRNPGALLSVLKNFKESDLVVTQYAGKKGGRFSLLSKLFARVLAKKGALIGFTDASKLNGALYDRLVPVRPDVAVDEHDREALRAAGLRVSLPFPKLDFIRDDSAHAAFNLEAGKFIVVHLFAGNAGRGLNPDKKHELLKTLSEELPDIRLVVSGGAADREEAVRAAEGISVEIIAGRATLQELMNLIVNSRGVISVDTGVAHISAQLGVPLTVLRTCVGRNWWLPGQYGPAAPIRVFSCDKLCADGHVSGDYPICINSLSMGEVVRGSIDLTGIRATP